MLRRGPVLAGIGILVFSIYVAVLGWVLAAAGVPSPGVAGFVLVAIAVPIQAAATWIFGQQFRHGLSQTGRDLQSRAAFKAALIGAGVARLLPAGGAVTPLAMSWSTRAEARGTAGAAVRATTLNYAGLLIGTGGVMLWIALRGRFPAHVAVPAAGIASAAILFGGALLFGSSRLGTLGERLPEWLRAKAGSVLQDYAIDLPTFVLVTSRLICEAAVLGLVLAAFGSPITPAQVFAVFGISQLIGGLPGTPGGLGLTEAGLVGTLAVFGIPPEQSLAPTLVYRLISYWLPVGAGLSVGGAAFMSARIGNGRSAQRSAAEPGPGSSVAGDDE